MQISSNPFFILFPDQNESKGYKWSCRNNRKPKLQLHVVLENKIKKKNLNEGIVESVRHEYPGL